MFEKDLERFQSAQFRAEFITCVYKGDNLAEACASCRVNPAALGIYRRKDVDFDNDIRAAQEFRVDMLADKLENIQDHESDPIMAGVMSKNIQWLATKRARRIYGEKLDVNHNVTINIRQAMSDAQQRTIKHIGGNALEDHTNSTDNISVQPMTIIDVTPDDDHLS